LAWRAYQNFEKRKSSFTFAKSKKQWIIATDSKNEIVSQDLITIVLYKAISVDECLDINDITVSREMILLDYKTLIILSYQNFSFQDVLLLKI